MYPTRTTSTTGTFDIPPHPTPRAATPAPEAPAPPAAEHPAEPRPEPAPGGAAPRWEVATAPGPDADRAAPLPVTAGWAAAGPDAGTTAPVGAAPDPAAPAPVAADAAAERAEPESVAAVPVAAGWAEAGAHAEHGSHGDAVLAPAAPVPVAAGWLTAEAGTDRAAPAPEPVAAGWSGASAAVPVEAPAPEVSSVPSPPAAVTEWAGSTGWALAPERSGAVRGEAVAGGGREADGVVAVGRAPLGPVGRVGLDPRSDVPAARVQAEPGVDIPHPQDEAAHAGAATLRLRNPDAETARPHPQDEAWPPGVSLAAATARAEHAPRHAGPPAAWDLPGQAGSSAEQGRAPQHAVPGPAPEAEYADPYPVRDLPEPGDADPADPADRRELTWSVPAPGTAGDAGLVASDNSPVGNGPVSHRPVENGVVGNDPVGRRPVDNGVVGNGPVDHRLVGNGPADSDPAGNGRPGRGAADGQSATGATATVVAADGEAVGFGSTTAVAADRETVDFEHATPMAADGEPATGGAAGREAVDFEPATSVTADGEPATLATADSGIADGEPATLATADSGIADGEPATLTTADSGIADGEAAIGGAVLDPQGAAAGHGIVPGPDRTDGADGADITEVVARAVARIAEDDTQDLPRVTAARGVAVTEVPVHLPFRGAAHPQPKRESEPKTSAPKATAPAPTRSAPGRRVPRGDDRLHEHRGPVLPGWIAVAVGGIALAGCAVVLWRAGAVPDSLALAFGAEPRPYRGLQARFWPPLAFLGVVALLALGGLGRGRAGHAWVLTLFGRYRGTVRRTGLTWISPLLLRRRVDVRLRHWRSDPMPAVDSGGLALQVVVQVVWQVKDTARATLAVEDHVDYLAEQVESAMARVLSQLPADAFHEDAPTLRDAEAVGDALTRMLASETEAVGVEVFSAQPTRIEYAPEVADAMRRRRVAAIDAKHRDTVLTSVVDAVDDTVHRLTSRGIVELDDYERKALVKDLTVAFYTGRSE
ncbi:SPFH domain-containing protein [Streptomyces sp. NPDC056401]|uniref:SPFH domain-containing protein n=1 Tax=Streptomyces sp. NPDC056401 TaxID=3345809 RepID=UPI0035D6D998